MKTHSGILAWKIPWTEEPGEVQSIESQRAGHDWSDLACIHACMHWRRKWQPTPVFLPGESQGWRSLVGCHPWGSHRVGRNWSDLAAAASTLGFCCSVEFFFLFLNLICLNLLYFFYIYSFICFSYVLFPFQLIFNIYKSSSSTSI